MRQLGTITAEDGPRIGQLADSIKAEIEKLFEDKLQSLNMANDGVAAHTGPDLTLPGRYPAAGKLHPVTQVMRQPARFLKILVFPWPKVRISSSITTTLKH